MHPVAQLTILSLSGSTSLPSVWAVIGAVAGVYFFYHGFQLLQRKRLIVNTPSSKIRSAAMGLVEISGKASGPYTITAPITAAPCYYYRTIVWEWKQQGKGKTWVKTADESMHVPFFLEDSTGRLLVNPQGSELEIPRDFHDEFDQGLFAKNFGMLPNISGFLLSHGISSDEKVKVEEYCIKPKTPLFVLGTLAHNPGLTVTAGPIRTSPSAITLGAAAPSSLLGRVTSLLGSVDIQVASNVASFDRGSSASAVRDDYGNPHVLNAADQTRIAAALTKAGITNPAAWAAAGISPVQTAAITPPGSGASAAPAPALEQFDLHPPVVLMKGTHDPAFYISWQSQREIVGSLGWKAALMIWGGPVLTLFCVHILATQLGWW